MAQALGRLFGRAHKYSFRRAELDFNSQPSSAVIRIRNLKSSRDDGILFPDDCLSDVADDREQIIADFEENESSLPHYNCGDGTSTSSVCTGSPDLFSVEVSSHGSVQYAHSDVEVAEESPPYGVTPLQVRRGSEPALNSLCPASPTTDPSKRWSTAVVINPGSPSTECNTPEDSKVFPKDELVVNGDSKPSSRNFNRSSGRLSILGNNPETYRWVQAADRQLIKDINDKLSVKPLVPNCSSEREAGSDSSSTSEERERSIILKNESGPLGIHVVPGYDTKDRVSGLVIQGIEAGGRIDRDGRFCVGDRIVEINSNSLRCVTFQAAHEIFKNALRTPQIKLELVQGHAVPDSKNAAVPKRPPPPVYPKPVQPEELRKAEEDSTLVEGEERVGGVTTKVATVTPTKKVPAMSMHRLASANTRRIGKKVAIQLKKDMSGLGFSITTRDNPAGGNSPIYIKNILPKGAAIEDGRLQPGDRLLEVNGIEMTGKSQAEAVQILRNAPMGGIVSLVVSRQELETSPTFEQRPNLPQPLKPEDEPGIFPWKHREVLTFQIPLSDTGSAGLGVSVKGKSTTNSTGTIDLGIFVKSVIAGGAASKDGRLQPDDQLVNINNISLLGISNSSAMETLRKAMTQFDGPIPNAIFLTVARRINAPSEDDQETSSIHSKLSNVNSQGSVLSNFSDKYDERTDFRKEGDKLSVLSNGIATTSNQIKDLSSGKKLNTNPPGCNPVIERLTGQTMNGYVNGDPYVFGGHNVSDNMQQTMRTMCSEGNMQSYSPTINVAPCESVLIEDEYSTNAAKLSKPSASADSVLLQHSQTPNSNGENSSVVPASSQMSLDELNDGFARDGFGRQSMSEKRHAQLDARNTDTYQRNKKAREERERSRQDFEKEYLLEQQQQLESSQGKSVPQLNTLPASLSSVEDIPRGPSLGLRKSSSLESLQTMIQELNKDDEALKNALQSTNTRSSRNRGCNESFRAAVDRSYEAPVPATMETLDEESESGSSVGHVLGRSSEISDAALGRESFHEDVLNMYCRNSKTSKKKSLFKGLGSVFKFGKSRKGDIKGKFGDDLSHETEQQLQSGHINREHERAAEQEQRVSDLQRKPLPSIPREVSSSSVPETMPNRQERMQNLREQHQRLHQKRQGHYPLEQKEELYESEIQAKESRFGTVSAVDIAHIRSHSHDEIESRSRGAFSEGNRYSHYMNYKEIQQHMNQYYHQDQTQVPKVPPLQNPDNYFSHRSAAQPDRPSSNYFEYESVQHIGTSSQVPELDSSSLPRGSRSGVERSTAHLHAQNSKYLYGRKSTGAYERQNTHHYYPNSALYSHVVPGSKV